MDRARFQMAATVASALGVTALLTVGCGVAPGGARPVARTTSAGVSAAMAAAAGEAQASGGGPAGVEARCAAQASSPVAAPRATVMPLRTPSAQPSATMGSPASAVVSSTTAQPVGKVNLRSLGMRCSATVVCPGGVRRIELYPLPVGRLGLPTTLATCPPPSGGVPPGPPRG